LLLRRDIVFAVSFMDTGVAKEGKTAITAATEARPAIAVITA
jgi:hypothetical protein